MLSIGLGLALLSTAAVGCPDPEEPGAYPEPGGPWTVALELDRSEGAFLSVWGPSADDVWAVGGQVASIGDDGQGAIYRRTDGTWAPAEVPTGTPLLNWVHGHDGEIWAVGNAGSALRFDGSAWQTVDTGADVALWGVFVFSPSEVWAVGGDAFVTDTPGVILRYDGTSWSESPLPTLDRDSGAVFKIFGLSTDDIHAVGARGVLLHYDGSAWTQMPSGTSNDMISIWGTEPDDIIAVGGRAVGTIGRWDGSGWTTEDIGMLPGLNGVWVDPEGRATVVGNNGASAILREGSEAEREDTTISFEVLHAVFGLEDGTRISVGGTLNSSPPYTGIVVENAP